MSDHNQAERAAPCPFCRGELNQHGDFYVHPYGACFFSEWEFDALNIEKWNRRAPAVGEDGLPPLLANVVHVTRRIRRCESDVPAQVVLEHFAIEYAREAVAAYKRKHAALQEMVDIAQESDMGYGTPVGAAQDVKTWQERLYLGYEACDQLEAMEAEITELRAEITRQSVSSTCVGCEGRPSPENNPCAVCGASAPQQASQKGENDVG